MLEKMQFFIPGGGAGAHRHIVPPPQQKILYETLPLLLTLLTYGWVLLSQLYCLLNNISTVVYS